jgi:hypothetical protein
VITCDDYVMLHKNGGYTCGNQVEVFHFKFFFKFGNKVYWNDFGYFIKQ